MQLSSHPRLYVGASEFAHAKQRPASGKLLDAWNTAVELADAFLAEEKLVYNERGHNAHLIRARMTQGRVLTLLLRHFQTGRAEFRAKAMEHIRKIATWQEWSWIAWRKGDKAKDATYDLSYGENSTTLAIAWDWLHDSLSAAERRLFLKTARERTVAAFMRHTGGKKRAHWFGHPDSNWNSVCAGGAGMLALAMYEELPEARTMLARVEKSLEPFFKTLRATDGGWPEGIGYWNYGMRYGFMYLLSHERATGAKHPLMRHPSVAKTLGFPLDFSPNGTAAGFGDAGGRWSPLPFHYATARRLGRNDLLGIMDERFNCKSESLWPSAAEYLLLHPRQAAKPARTATAGREKQPETAVFYRGLGWAVLADKLPNPGFCLTIRGGSTAVPHSHLDIFSFNCVAGTEALLANVNNGEYLDSTFSPRRWELFDISAQSKNTIIINGLGVPPKSAADIAPLRFGELDAFRLVYNQGKAAANDYHGSQQHFLGRLFVRLAEDAFLVVDRVVLGCFGIVESRLHTKATAEIFADSAKIRGSKESLSISFACDQPAKLWTAAGATSVPREPAATMLRWCTDERQKETTMATLLRRGGKSGEVKLVTAKGGTEIRVKIGTRSITLRLDGKLKPVAGRR